MDRSELKVGSTYKDTTSGEKILIDSNTMTKEGRVVIGIKYDPIKKDYVRIKILDGQLNPIVVDDIDGF